MNDWCERCGQTLCKDCVIALLPNWFWWDEVPDQYRATVSILRTYLVGENDIKRFRKYKKSGRCECATVRHAARHIWQPCNRPGAGMKEGRHICKVHLNQYKAGAFTSGVPPRLRVLLPKRVVL